MHISGLLCVIVRGVAGGEVVGVNVSWSADIGELDRWR